MSLIWYLFITFCYVVCGMMWGFFRWAHFVDDELDYYETERTRFLLFHRIRGDDIPSHLHFEWRDIVQKNVRLREVPPLAGKYVGEIAFDIILWPISVLTLGVQQIFGTFMRQLIAQYNKVTDTKIERIKKDLKGKP